MGAKANQPVRCLSHISRENARYSRIKLARYPHIGLAWLFGRQPDARSIIEKFDPGPLQGDLTAIAGLREQLRLRTRSRFQASDEARATPKFHCGVVY